MSGPHDDQPVVSDGVALSEADAACILVHGRGATARSILGMAHEFNRQGVAYLAPQAAQNTWYPHSFLAPVTANEPGRSSGLSKLESIIGRTTDAGIARERILIGGFSQGACLATEFVARTPTRYGGLFALSGGLIGESITPEEYTGDLDGTPAFLGCSDRDPHIPEQRVHVTADVLEQLGATVDTRIYPNMPHTVNQDELTAVGELLDSVLDS